MTESRLRHVIEIIECLAILDGSTYNPHPLQFGKLRRLLSEVKTRACRQRMFVPPKIIDFTSTANLVISQSICDIRFAEYLLVTRSDLMR